MITTAPGKVILFGEHAVCFGKPAIATAIDRRTKVEIHLTPGSGYVTLNLINLDHSFKWSLEQLSSLNFDVEDAGDDNAVGKLCFGKLLDSDQLRNQLNGDHGTEVKGETIKSATESAKSFLFLYLAIASTYGDGKLLEMDITISSDIPIGGGLGSSAAFSVSLAGGLLRAFLNKLPDNEMVNKWAFQSEQLFHGKPSGIDNNIATAGGTLMFKDNRVEQHQQSTSLRLRQLILVETGVKRNTKTLVDGTISRRKMFPGVINKVIDAIGDIAGEAWNTLNGDHSCNFKTLVEMNQHLLNCLGAGHTCIDEILLIAKKHGFSGKLTGAGGGGCVIIFPEDASPESMKNLLIDLKEKGFKADQVDNHSPGISFQ